MSHANLRGYTTVASARAAYEAARSRGLLFSCFDAVATVSRQISETRLTSDDLILCLAFLDDEASCAIASEDHDWYVVLKGSQPGVYRT